MTDIQSAMEWAEDQVKDSVWINRDQLRMRLWKSFPELDDEQVEEVVSYALP
jgi:uncharacterized protein (DUF433 family)